MDGFNYLVIGIIVAIFLFVVARLIMTKGRAATKPYEFKDRNTDIQDTTHG